MPAGRPKKPRALKVVQGTNRPHRNNNEAEVPPEMPPCPDWLGKEAKKYWSQIAPQLVNAQLVGATDTVALSLHCDSYARYVEVAGYLKNINDWLDETPNGMQIQSALVQIRNKLWDQALRSATVFGLSPQARSNINIPEKPAKKDDPWGDI